jgi:hypothetical protein
MEGQDSHDPAVPQSTLLQCESRMEEWENEIWKNHTDAATLHFNVFSLAFNFFQARVTGLL